MGVFETIYKRVLEKKNRLKSLGKLSDVKLKEIEKNMEIEFVYNSNRIEGSTLTRGETRLVLEGMTVGKKRLANIITKNHEDIQAARNHPNAMEWIKKLTFDKHYRITENDIKKLHRMIMQGIMADTGQYRTHDIDVVGAGFTPPPHYEIQKQMKQLVDLINNNPDELRPIELAAQAHYDLVWTHPFSDGNGRVARLLLNFILLRNGYPFTVIKAVEKKTYLHALRHMDINADIEPFKIYIIRCIEQTLDVYLQESEKRKEKMLPLSKLAKDTSYSAEYLSLLARKGRIDAIKEGKTWKTTKKVINTYVKQQFH